MKKLIAVSITLYMLLAIGAFSYAAESDVEESKTINLDIYIGSLFGFAIGSGESSQTFAAISPLETSAELEVNAACSTNHNAIWYLNAESAGLIGPGTTLPIYARSSTTVGTGTILDPAEALDNVPPKVIYVPAVGEYNIAGLAIVLGMTVTAAADQQVGTYSGQVLMTMTE